MNVSVAQPTSATSGREEHATLAKGATSLLALLAGELGRSAARQDSARDARLATDAQQLTTDALQLANDLHDFGELLADLAGVEP